MKKFILLSVVCLGAGYSSIAQTSSLNQVLGVTATPANVAYQTVTSGINEVNIDKAIRIFPNPAAHEISVVSGDGYNIAGCDLYVYDEKGRQVMVEKNRTLKGGAAVVNVQHLPVGVYTLMLKTSDNKAVVNKRFVISR